MNPDGGLVVSFIWPGGKIPYDRLVVHRGQRELLEVVGALDATGRQPGPPGRPATTDAIRAAMMAITTESSISVKPRACVASSSKILLFSWAYFSRRRRP